MKNGSDISTGFLCLIVSYSLCDSQGEINTRVSKGVS